MEEQVRLLLDTILHPETGEGLVKSGFVAAITVSEEKISVTLQFTKVRDPFSVKISKQVQALLAQTYPAAVDKISVLIKEGAPNKPLPEKKITSTGEITHMIAVASGKGGVGKSTVTANIAITLRNMGYRVGILDADIYGPSQPKMFGLEGYTPAAEMDEQAGIDYILPAERMGIKLMSIGFFIKPTDALMWRGAMASNALKQMIHQTKWGSLDFLLIDLPPGTGDVHLSLIAELKLSGVVMVSTPQQIAVADVIRGVEMFQHKQVNIPILGLIENMAWFTPAELPENRYYLFGKGGAHDYATQHGLPFLGEIPIVQSVMEGAEKGMPGTLLDPNIEKYYRQITEQVVHKLSKQGD
ncbi:MAG: Mrp/NBP35 family ATP-binding protein [Alistipes sp.]